MYSSVIYATVGISLISRVIPYSVQIERIFATSQSALAMVVLIHQAITMNIPRLTIFVILLRTNRRLFAVHRHEPHVNYVRGNVLYYIIFIKIIISQ